MSQLTADRIVNLVGALPPLPDTLCRLISVANDPQSSLPQIVEIIRYDQGLTAEVLRLSNSAYYGVNREINSLDDAVRLLGNQKILQLVISAHARSLLSRPQAGYGLPAGGLWLHSVGVALAAQRLARPMNLDCAGLLFTAGLLHDVGKVILNDFVAQEYTEITRRVALERISFAEAEAEILGFTHPEIGGRLAEAWGLPASITNCIRYHHEPETLSAPEPHVDAVHLADALCISLGIGGGDDGLAYRLSGAALARYSITHAELEAFGADVIAELKSVQSLLSGK